MLTISAEFQLPSKCQIFVKVSKRLVNDQWKNVQSHVVTFHLCQTAHSVAFLNDIPIFYILFKYDGRTSKAFISYHVDTHTHTHAPMHTHWWNDKQPQVTQTGTHGVLHG